MREAMKAFASTYSQLVSGTALAPERSSKINKVGFIPERSRFKPTLSYEAFWVTLDQSLSLGLTTQGCEDERREGTYV